MIHFTADHHFFHKSIIQYCKRPFPNEKNMRTKMIARHNEVVKKGDTVYFVGDVAMIGTSQWEMIKGVIGAMNGTKHLVLGNHDEIKPFRYVDCGFTSVHTALWQTIDGIKVVMAHDPSVYCAIDPESVLLCGHIHTLFKSIPDKLVVNVGVDQWNFRPTNMDLIRKELGI